MSIELEDKLNQLRDAIESSDPEEMCLASRALRWACDRAQACFGVWPEYEPLVRKTLLRALERIVILQDSGQLDRLDSFRNKVARFSFLRILDRYRSLFGHDQVEARFGKYEAEFGPIEELRKELLQAQR